MRCKQCGGILQHALTSVMQENYYQCNTGLTEMQETKEPGIQRGTIRLCGCVYNHEGKQVQDAIIQYWSDGRVQVARVENGRFKR